MNYANCSLVNMSELISSIIHTEEFRIISKMDSLFMIDTSLRRGMILDTSSKMVITQGFYNVTDSNILMEGDYYLGREGINIYIYKYNGTIYICDGNTLNNDDPILRAKILNVGLDIDSLFDINVNTSRFSYYYVISHRDDIIASKINMFYKEGFAYLIEQHVINDGVEMCPLLVHEELNVPKNIAQDFLVKGYHPDIIPNDNELLQLGEFVYIRTTKGQCYKVQSPSYIWRKKIRENELKVRYGFYKHLTLAMKAKKESNSKSILLKNDLEEYCRSFPNIPYIEPRSIESYIKTHGYILQWPKVGKLVNTNYIFNTWACYLHALPIHLHQEARDLYNDYYNVCFNCYSYIVALWKDNKELNADGNDIIAVRRIDDIIKQSNKNITESKVSSFEKNCQNLIKKERGSSLYAINEYVMKNRH